MCAVAAVLLARTFALAGMLLARMFVIAPMSLAVEGMWGARPEPLFLFTRTLVLK